MYLGREARVTIMITRRYSAIQLGTRMQNLAAIPYLRARGYGLMPFVSFRAVVGQGSSTSMLPACAARDSIIPEAPSDTTSGL